jgi:hypothetical protein
MPNVVLHLHSISLETSKELGRRGIEPLGGVNLLCAWKLSSQKRTEFILHVRVVSPPPKNYGWGLHLQEGEGGGIKSNKHAHIIRKNQKHANTWLYFTLPTQHKTCPFLSSFPPPLACMCACLFLQEFQLATEKRILHRGVRIGL